jgi:hypothetical protein
MDPIQGNILKIQGILSRERLFLELPNPKGTTTSRLQTVSSMPEDDSIGTLMWETPVKPSEAHGSVQQYPQEMYHILVSKT